MENHAHYRKAIAQLGDQIETQAKLIAAAMHELLTSIRRYDAAAGWRFDGATTCSQWLSWRLGLGASTARERVRVARALGVFQRIDAALANGKISYSKARAITRVVTAETEALLLRIALQLSGAQLERFCAAFRRDPNVAPPPLRFVRRRAIASSGMVRIEIQLEPERAETVWAALMQTASTHGAAGDGATTTTDVAEAIHRFAVHALAEIAPPAGATDASPPASKSPSPREAAPSEADGGGSNHTETATTLCDDPPSDGGIGVRAATRRTESSGCASPPGDCVSTGSPPSVKNRSAGAPPSAADEPIEERSPPSVTAGAEGPTSAPG
jgi:hypothetical protein